jgi:hypothetical protein
LPIPTGLCNLKPPVRAKLLGRCKLLARAKILDRLPHKRLSGYLGKVQKLTPTKLRATKFLDKLKPLVRARILGRCKLLARAKILGRCKLLARARILDRLLPKRLSEYLGKVQKLTPTKLRATKSPDSPRTLGRAKILDKCKLLARAKILDRLPPKRLSEYLGKVQKLTPTKLRATKSPDSLRTLGRCGLLGKPLRPALSLTAWAWVPLSLLMRLLRFNWHTWPLGVS